MDTQTQHVRISSLQAEADSMLGATILGLITKKVCCYVIGGSPATLTRKVNAGTFPEAIVSDGNFARWSAEAVKNWRDERIKNPALLFEDRKREREYREKQKRERENREKRKVGNAESLAE